MEGRQGAGGGEAGKGGGECGEGEGPEWREERGKLFGIRGKDRSRTGQPGRGVPQSACQ